MTLHAHIESYSTDCDGPISSSYVLTMNEDELKGQDEPNYFGDIYFLDRVVTTLVNSYSLLWRGTLEIECFDEGSTEKRMTWSEPTDEGHRQSIATICTDECDEAERSYRDHRAESMGY